MTRSIARLLDYAFEDLGLHRVEICVRPENTASLAVVARLGLRAEGAASASSISTASGATTSPSR